MTNKLMYLFLAATLFAGIALAQPCVVRDNIRSRRENKPCDRSLLKTSSKSLTATVSGKIYNDSLDFIAATITIGSLTAKTDPTSGAYVLTNVPISKKPVSMKIESAGYETLSALITISNENETKPLIKNFILKSSVFPDTGISPSSNPDKPESTVQQ